MLEISFEEAKKIVMGTFNDQDKKDVLYEICSAVHAGCNSDCPVFEKNHEIPWNEDLSNCLYFKDGGAMLRFLRDGQKQDLISVFCDICSLIGNIDHSIGNGPNSAKLRGKLLNDIRDITKEALKKGE